MIFLGVGNMTHCRTCCWSTINHRNFFMSVTEWCVINKTSQTLRTFFLPSCTEHLINSLSVFSMKLVVINPNVKSKTRQLKVTLTAKRATGCNSRPSIETKLLQCGDHDDLSASLLKADQTVTTTPAIFFRHNYLRMILRG